LAKPGVTLFPEDDPPHWLGDVMQSQTYEDSYFMAALVSIAEYPEKVKKMFLNE